MVSEKSYDALPNFTAADCKGFREREGWRKRRKEGGGREGGGREGAGKGRREEGEEGGKEGGLVTPLNYNSVSRSAADGCRSEPVH